MAAVKLLAFNWALTVCIWFEQLTSLLSSLAIEVISLGVNGNDLRSTWKDAHRR